MGRLADRKREMSKQVSVPEGTKVLDEKLRNSAFLKASRGEPTEFTPIWLMRQAGRFMPEYRKIRSELSFLELCKNSERAAEVTVMAVEQLGVDAAIIFADILLLIEPMGVGLEYAKGDGPIIHRPVRSGEDVEKLVPIDVKVSLDFVLEAIRKTRRQLKANVPLIGFAGAPFTLASYLIEGGSSRHFERTKSFMYSQPKSWHSLMAYLAKLTGLYLNAQIEAGAQAIQLFDSWVGCLSKDDYEEFVLPYSRAVFASLIKGFPAIHFGTGTAHLLQLMRQAGGSVIGLDWRVRLDEAWLQVGYDVAVQGNLDPVVLMADCHEIKRQSKRILQQAAGRPGYIFNLGHGVLPATSVDNVKFLVETVHELGRSMVVGAK